MGNTDNLNLKTHDLRVDPNPSFESYRLGLSNVENSNMTLIDAWGGMIPVLLTALAVNTSSSVVTYNNNISHSSGCVTVFNSGSASIESRFKKLDEFSGSGQADFNTLDQNFTHILILGVASVNYSASLVNVGCDFNGDSSSGNYKTINWYVSGSYSGSLNDFTVLSTCQILLGNVSGSANSNYGGTFFAVIPYYSGSGGFYKAAMGLSMNHIFDWIGGMKSGGCWTSTSPITRIRIFGSKDSTRYNFIDGTKISVYGFE